MLFLKDGQRKRPRASAETAMRARLATIGLFFMTGMMYASWGLYVPALKEKFSLNEALLSLALLAIAFGSICALKRIGAWVASVGSRIACTAGGLLMCLCIALVPLTPWFALLLPLLVLFGACAALLEIAMNAEAIAVEAALKRPLVSWLHGMFSVGGMAGAAGGGLLLSHAVSPTMHLALAAAAGAAIALIAQPALLPSEQTKAKPSTTGGSQAPSGLWLLRSIALIAFMAEGALYDWLTVYSRETLNASSGMVGAIYALFLTGMAIGRFCGDRIRTRIGNHRLLLASGWLACIAMIISLLFPYPSAALFSFAFVGLGIANMAPLLLLGGARVEGVHAAEGIAHVAGMAYMGLLIGPALIGVTASLTTLPIGLALVAVCAALVASLGPRALSAQ